MAEYTIDKIEYGGNVYKLQDTDEKLKVEAVSASEVTSYFPIVSAFSATDAAIRQRDTTGFEYEVFSGTTSSTGAAGIRLGNKTATGTAGNKKGFITIYGTGSNSSTLYGPSGGTASYNVWLPNNGGTLALTTDITDEKVAVGGITSGSTYYPIVGSGTAAATRQIDTTGFSYDATTSTTGYARITLGNSTAQPTSGSKYGALRLYGTTANSTTIVSGAPTAIRTITLPDKTGTVALTDDIPDVSGKIDTAGTGLSKSGTTLNHSNSITAQTTQAVYPIKIDAQGHISAYGNAVTIPTIPSNNVTGSGTVNYLARWSGTNTLSTTSLYISTSYNSNSDSYGTIKLYVGSTGQVDWKGQLVFYSGGSNTITITPPSLTASRTLTLPNKTGTIALTSDLPTVPSNIVNTITTTAGAHTAITSQKDNVSFNVPTKTSHLTNDSGFITTDTNTTYTLSGALSSHKFTSTLTAGGSGSGTSTSDFTLAAGTGITITDDTSNRKMTIACSVTNTDTKVSTAAITSGTTYYPTLGSDTTSAATKFYDKTGISYVGTTGSAVNGIATLTLGNNATGGSGKYGKLTIYSASQYGATFQTGSAFTADRTFSLPDKNGTIALTRDLDSYLQKPTGYDNPLGWKLTCDGTDTPVWNPPETFMVIINEDNQNSGNFALGNVPDDVREAVFQGETIVLNLGLYNQSTMAWDEHKLVNYRVENIQGDNDYIYQIVWFSGIKNYFDGTQLKTQRILCGIYLDSEEQYHTDGEVFVKINDDVAINGDIIVRGHGSPIGDRVQKEGGTDWTTNVPQTGYTTAGTWYQLGTISLTAGRWIIIARARFTPKESGNHYSSINISTTPRLEAVRDRKYGTGTYYNQHSTAMIIGLAEDAIVCVNGASTVSGVWTRTNNSAFTIDAIRIM